MFRQLEEIIRKFFFANMEAWGVTAVNGSPHLRLDFHHLAFNDYEGLSQGTFSLKYTIRAT